MGVRCGRQEGQFTSNEEHICNHLFSLPAGIKNKKDAASSQCGKAAM